MQRLAALGVQRLAALGVQRFAALGAVRRSSCAAARRSDREPCFASCIIVVGVGGVVDGVVGGGVVVGWCWC